MELLRSVDDEELNVVKVGGVKEFKKLPIEKRAELFAEDVLNCEVMKDKDYFRYSFMASLVDFNGKSTAMGEVAESLESFAFRMRYPMPEKRYDCAWFHEELGKEELVNAYKEVIPKWEKENMIEGSKLLGLFFEYVEGC